jgi:hypothetical protein
MKEITLQEAALAWAQGKRVEAAWKPDDGKLGRWGLIYNFTTGVGEYWPVIFNDPNGWHFRLAPEPPAKRYRPWTVEEVPVGCLVKAKDTGSIWVLGGRNNGGSIIIHGDDRYHHVGWIFDNYLHSIDPIGTPNSKRTWLPCGVEVEA